MPYRPPTLRDVSTRIKTWEDFRVEFFDWLDDLYRYPEERMRLIRDPILPPEDERFGAFMAAAVHQLCLTYDLEIPMWVFEDRYYLKDPWFWPPEINVRPTQFVESPGAFRARNIWVFADVLDRV